ncbi:thioesterase family protein [Halobacillus sp. A5]|uniref:acyl-CoA thioesterase n=1 Tax=Halobacillus sp. A5 TaxID=2880263 RepID=UPI0020A667AE|nr:thioesterase family protein [Halobacillus sp. A5]MCP3027953.1 acyl-CoA thioesterase [Halobacillus sp. A5]
MKHETDTTVRFCETDAAGHVNNTSYFIYLEEARGRFFQSNLENYQTFGRFIIASTKCDFLSQAYFNQQLIISTWISKIGTKSFQFKHEIKAKDTGVSIAEAEAAIVYFNYEEQKSEPIPEDVRKRLEGQLVTS